MVGRRQCQLMELLVGRRQCRLNPAAAVAPTSACPWRLFLLLLQGKLIMGGAVRVETAVPFQRVKRGCGPLAAAAIRYRMHVAGVCGKPIACSVCLQPYTMLQLK